MANVTDEARRTEGYLNMRRGWFLYLQDIEPERPRLFRYCRKLTGNVWDAEDLVQDTMLKGFGLLAHHDNDVLQWGPYLARIASNLWIDQKRKSQPVSLDDIAEPTTPATAETASAVREGGRALMTHLSPQERCAIIMKEVFEYTIKEIASLLETTEGAIKAALHRGREKLRAPLPSTRSGPSEALVFRFVEAFNAGDMEAIKAVMLETVTAEVFALGTGHGLKEIGRKDRWIGACLYGHSPDPSRHQRAACASYLGEPLVLLFRHFGDSDEKLEEIWRFKEEQGHIAHIWDYCACPETLTEVATDLGIPHTTRPYSYYNSELMQGSDQSS